MFLFSSLCYYAPTSGKVHFITHRITTDVCMCVCMCMCVCVCVCACVCVCVCARAIFIQTGRITELF